MGFHTTRFPVDISFEAEGGPTYRTDIVETEGGHEYRNQSWTQSRLKWDVSHAARSFAKAQALLAFFRQVRGRTHSFRFKDWADYQVPDEAGIGVFALVPDESPANSYQLYKRYGSGALLENRKITRPVSGTVTVTGATVLDIDYDTGVVITSGGTPSSWEGEFDIPCRFDIDSLRQNLIDRSGDELIVGWDSVPIVEVRE